MGQRRKNKLVWPLQGMVRQWITVLCDVRLAEELWGSSARRWLRKGNGAILVGR